MILGWGLILIAITLIFDFRLYPMTNVTFITDPQSPKASEEEIQEFESQLGIRLPEEYRNYLLKHNGALPRKLDYWMPGEKNWIESVHEMYALLSTDHPRSIRQFLTEDYGVPSGWLPIANSGYGDFTVISMLEEDFGAIYYLFHEVHGYDPTERTRGVYKLASSFTEWIHGLEDLSNHD